MAFRRHRGFTVSQLRDGAKIRTGERQVMRRADRGARPVNPARVEEFIWYRAPTRKEMETQTDYMEW